MPKRRKPSSSKDFGSLVSLLSPKLILPSCRHSPLPNFSWADSSDVWEFMQRKEKLYRRNPLVLHRHPGLEASMRAILLDWLSEVCEVYQLHKETYYLAIDYIDRYLSFEANVPKQSLQLIGITCLFISAKTEEIYPPKLSEFAFVTDGACSEQDILLKELVIIKSLNWHLYPMTISSWLNIYLQLYSFNEKENCDSPQKSKKRKLLSCTENNDENGDFLIPKYSTYFFSQISHLVDLCIFDIESLRFPYNVIAASAFFHFTNEESTLQCTGLSLDEIKECVQWLTPFAIAIQEDGFDKLKIQKSEDDLANIYALQSHSADLSLLEKAHEKKAELSALNLLAKDEDENSDALSCNSDKENGPLNDNDNNNNISSNKNEKLVTSTTAGATANCPPSSPIPSSSILTPPRSHSKAGN